MRFVFLLVILAGVALAGLYPWYNNHFSGEEIGVWSVYERDTGFRQVEAALSPSQAPVRVLVDLTTVTPVDFSRDATVLTLTADIGSRTVLADTMSFGESKPRTQSPQMQAQTYRADAGVITPTEAGTYRFTVGQGDAEGINFSKVELVLRSGTAITDPRAQPAGFSLIAIGVIGLVVASRLRRRSRDRRQAEPPPTQWGRGGDR